MEVVINADYPKAKEVGLCLIGNTCEVGQYTGLSRGVKGTIAGIWGNYFVCNFPMWDGDFDTSDHKELLFSDPVADPWKCCQYEIPILARSSKDKSMVSGKLLHPTERSGPGQERKWLLESGVEVYADKDMGIDLASMGEVDGIKWKE